MGCESSQSTKQISKQEMRISILDSSFMKKSNESIRKEMEEMKIQYDFYIALSIFYEQFSKRYYNEVVTNLEQYDDLYKELTKRNFYPNIYVITNSVSQKNYPQNVTILESYQSLISNLLQKKKKNYERNQSFKDKENKPTEKTYLKILWGPDSNESEQEILNTVLSKYKIKNIRYKNFGQLQQSLNFVSSEFILVDYIYHQQTVELVSKTKTKVICYCTFDEEEKYSPNLFFLSNNALQIANQIKKQISEVQRPVIKCTKVYLYSPSHSEIHEQIRDTIQHFNLDIRIFKNPEKVIKETTYFFCVTVIAEEAYINKLHKFFVENQYSERIKLISLKKNTEPNVKDLRKVIKEIKIGYKIEKVQTKTIDIIDKHYNSSKFQQIKKELEFNDINFFGYENLTDYIKNKKFISPFIICNFEEKILLVRYLKQLQVKSKIIVFCNKKKITGELLNKKCFSYINSHFGKILKYIKKTLVYQPLFKNEFEVKMEENFEKVKTKNKRISALKWCGLNGKSQKNEDPQNFEFLNIEEKTNHGIIKDIQKSNTLLWDCQINILENFSQFKENLIESLKELKKVFKVSYPIIQFNEMMEKIRQMSLPQLIVNTKQFFDSSHEFGLAINQSLINLESMNRKDISHMKQFMNLASLNYISFFSIPSVGKLKLKHWISHSLIQKCQVGSYLFSKQFMVMYEDSLKVESQTLSNYKIEVQINYDTLKHQNLQINPFFIHKDKYIFSPFSEFILEKIESAGTFKIITLKYLGNSQFLMKLYRDNFLGETRLMDIFENDHQYYKTLSKNIEEEIQNNYERIRSIHLFKEERIDESIKIHEKLIQNEESEENFNYNTINGLKYELSSFLHHSDNEKVASVLKDLMQSHPGSYIKEQCQKMISKYKIEEDGTANKENKNVNEDENEEEQQVKNKTIKSSSVSQDVYETFLWLQNQEDSQSQNPSLEDLSNNNDHHDEDLKYQGQMKCMQIDDLGNAQDESIQ